MITRLASFLRLGALAIALCALPALLPPAQAADDSYIETPGAAGEAIEAILAKAGRTPRVLEIVLEKDLVTFKGQALMKSYHVDAWYLVRKWIWKFPLSRVRGPDALDGRGAVEDVESGLFDLSDIALDQVSEVARAAIIHAALEGAAHVAEVRIGRSVSNSPKPAYGNIRWVITVKAGAGQATVYADAKGEIIGSDVAAPRRAGPLNTLRDDDFLPEAGRALAEALGPREVVHEIRFYDSYIYVEAESPNDPDKATSYSWNRAGIRRGSSDSPNMLRLMGNSDDLPYSIAEIDLAAVPAIKNAAREALKMPDGFVTRLEAGKSARLPGKPRVLWEVEVTSAGNEKGTALLDPKGLVIRASPPKSKSAPVSWLAPDRVRQILDRMDKELGTGIRFHEIRFDNDSAHVTAEDQAKPGDLAQFIMDDDETRRWGTPMFEKTVSAERAFTLEDVKSLDEARLAELSRRAVERMKLPDGRVFRITLERVNAFVRSPRSMVMVEFRVDRPDESRGGRVTYDVEGQELDVVMP